jgi:hypothetical protein
MQFKTKFPLLFQTLELFALFFIVALVNMNSFIRIRQFPEVDNYSDHEWDYIIVALIAVLLMIFVLRENQLLDQYLTAWKHNKLLILFLLYSVITLFWTVYFPATLYKLIFLLFSTLAGAYVAVRYRLSGVADILVWVGGIFAVLSVLIVVYFPFIGTMFKEY